MSSKTFRSVSPRASHPRIDVMDRVDGIQMRHVPPLTTLLVWTKRSLYRLVVMEGSHIYVLGGIFFPGPTAAHLDGARLDYSHLKAGWIQVGLPMEITTGDRHVVTSPVVAIVNACQLDTLVATS